MPSLLISVPTVPDGSVNVHLAAFLANVRGVLPGWEIVAAFVQDKPVASTRNRQARDFLDGGYDYGLFIDDDAVPDKETFLHLVEDIQRDDVDAVGGWSLRVSEHGPIPVVLKFRDDGGADPHEEILSREPGLYEIADGGMGAHCLMVKRGTMQRFHTERVVWFKDVLRDGSLERSDLEEFVRVYRDRKADLYHEIEHWLSETRDKEANRLGERRIGQDVWFCRRMHDLGLRLWVDTRVLWGHIKPCDLRGEFFAMQALRRKEAMQNA